MHTKIDNKNVPMELTGEKTKAQPISCPRGHQLYVMFFHDANRFGFGCGTCKAFSLQLSWNGALIEMKVVDSDLQPHLLNSDAN